MLKTEHFLALLVLCFVSCGAREINCPDSTRPHKTECNKYFKCIKLPSNSLTWITLTCQEGLVYDKNLRSCAITPENWDCNLSSEVDDDDDAQKGENNVNDVENLDSPQTEANFVEEEGDFVRKESDEFLEVIDGDRDLENLDETSRSDDSENSGEDTSESSGDGNLESFVTPSSSTVSMITTQVQRLSQLVQNIPNTSDDITPDDLNSYLATQKIQSSSPDYRYNSEGKTTVPADGKVHPEIESEIINIQNNLNAKLTTVPMDITTPPTSIKPIFYINKEPITEIKLQTGQGLEGIGTHQIVVNRPEGSVMFNVPATSDNTNKQNQPYLSQDILKTILELSKQMVSQKTSNNQDNHQQQSHPIYYAVPVPIVPPQNNVQNYYGHFPNQTIVTTESPQITNDKYPTTPQYKQPNIKNSNNFINSYGEPYKGTYEADETNINADSEIIHKLGPYQTPPVRNNHHHNRHHHKNSQQINNQYAEPAYNVKNQQGSYQNYNQQQYQQKYPINYYSPYKNNYPQNYQQFYNSQPYNQYSENDGYNTQNNFNQFSNYNGAYYGNRPFVSDSSAPFVDHTYNLQKNPYRKESFSSSSLSYENDDYDALHEESEDDSEKFDDDLLDDESEEEHKEKGPTDGLICTFALARQVNKTDCFKYYVCNAKTKEVLSYTCPAFTAFNDQTKYCDSGMYKECKKSQDQLTGNFKNKKYYAEAQKALQQAKRESQKAERIANLVKKQSQRIIYNRRNQAPNNYEPIEDESNYYQPPQIQQAPIIQRPKQTRRTRPKNTKRVQSTLSKSSKRKGKPKKIKCISIGNIADPEDSFSYWHCFKSTDGRMKRIHKKCSENLRFCPETLFCSPTCS